MKKIFGTCLLVVGMLTGLCAIETKVKETPQLL